MVRLDAGGYPATRLDYVRVEGSLHQKLDWLVVIDGLGDELALGLLEGPDELPAYDLALLFGIANSTEGSEKLLLGVYNNKLDAGGGNIVALNLLCLALAQQAVINKYSGQLVANRAMNKCCRNC